MKRLLLLAMSAALLLTTSARGARSVPVQLDGTLLDAACYVESGVTYVPLRALLNALGGWDIWWDKETQEAVAVSAATQIVADPSEDTVTIDGDTRTARVTLENGRTYVPARLIMEELGGGAEWDRYLGGAALTSPAADYNARDLYWLSRVIYAESGAEPLEGQSAVGNVVLNRVASEEFPNTVPAVVFDRKDGVQFEPVENGTVYRAPTAKSTEAAIRVLEGENTIGAAMYFYAPALSQGIWINANRTYLRTIGCHRFYL